MTRVTTAAASVPRQWRWAVLAVAVLGQVVALYLPDAHVPATGLPTDKVGHFFLFAVVAAVAVWAGVPWPAVLAVLVGQALLSEAVQQWILPDRGGEWGDLAADVLGTATGVAVGWPLRPAPEPHGRG